MLFTATHVHGHRSEHVPTRITCGTTVTLVPRNIWRQPTCHKEIPKTPFQNIGLFPNRHATTKSQRLPSKTRSHSTGTDTESKEPGPQTGRRQHQSGEPRQTHLEKTVVPGTTTSYGHGSFLELMEKTAPQHNRRLRFPKITMSSYPHHRSLKQARKAYRLVKRQEIELRTAHGSWADGERWHQSRSKTPFPYVKKDTPNWKGLLRSRPATLESKIAAILF
jgi:hypothetical protein